jgi:hypothetical protein
MLDIIIDIAFQVVIGIIIIVPIILGIISVINIIWHWIKDMDW